MLSLQLLAEAFEPVRNSSVWPSVMRYLVSDLLTAFMLGAVFAFAIHSSVAAILMCIALAELGAIPLPVGIALTLGANLGSSLIPLWLARGASTAARRVLLGNFCLRGTIAIGAILVGMWIWPNLQLRVGSAGQTLILVHITFNSALLLFLPILPLIGRALLHLLPEPTSEPDAIDQWRSESCLTPSPGTTSALAIANIRRETLRMSSFLTSMAQPALGFYQASEQADRDRIQRMGVALQKTLDVVRTYAADIDVDGLSKVDRRDMRDLIDIAIDLTAAGHIIADRLMPFAASVQSEPIKFSKQGWAELQELNDTVIENMSLAFGAIARDDTSLARSVVEAKTSIRKLERQSRKLHFQRLRNGSTLSFSSSDVHLETLRALKELNSKITEIVYPMLLREGQLSETRLIPNPN